MKRRHVSIRELMAAVLAIIVSASSSAAEPRSYPMTCKGGPGMVLKINPGSQDVVIDLQFKRGSRPASQGLNSDECTWSDRGMNADEPGVMMFDLEGIFMSMTVGPKSIVKFNPQAMNSSAGANAAAIARILDAIGSGREFQVQAYSDRGKLRVTRLGP